MALCGRCATKEPLESQLLLANIAGVRLHGLTPLAGGSLVSKFKGIGVCADCACVLSGEGCNMAAGRQARMCSVTRNAQREKIRATLRRGSELFADGDSQRPGGWGEEDQSGACGELHSQRSLMRCGSPPVCTNTRARPAPPTRRAHLKRAAALRAATPRIAARRGGLAARGAVGASPSSSRLLAAWRSRLGKPSSAGSDSRGGRGDADASAAGTSRSSSAGGAAEAATARAMGHRASRLAVGGRTRGTRTAVVVAARVVPCMAAEPVAHACTARGTQRRTVPGLAGLPRLAAAAAPARCGPADAAWRRISSGLAAAERRRRGFGVERGRMYGRAGGRSKRLG
eukprot:366239-Chlamydomonas_euryale.AAC.43